MEETRLEPFRRLLYGFCGVCVGFVVSLSIFQRAREKTLVQTKVQVVERPVQKQSGFSKEELLATLKEMNLKFYDIVYAQAIIETGHFTSNIFRNGNNLFGMKFARQRPTTAIGEYKGHAKYESWEESVVDYALFQAAYMKKCKTREEYLEYLGRNYAGDPGYVSKIRILTSKIS
jgi:uncharacterized FlgJ-related protein